MRPFSIELTDTPANPALTTRIPTALTGFADEILATVGRLFAYVGILAFIAILCVHFWEQLRHLADGIVVPPSWSVADRSSPAFGLGAAGHPNKSVTYAILRHPGGGRRDIFSWPGAGDRPAAELEIYQLGDEAASASTPTEDLALRMPPGSDLDEAGVIDTKFGSVALLRRSVTLTGTHGPRTCLGFFKAIDLPALRISGWSCRGDTLPAQRATVSCMLDRLTLLAAGNEPKLAELFARADLEQRNCAASPANTPSGDWVTETANPHLRGAL